MSAPTQSYMVSGTRFDLPARYTPIKPIGQGAYGVVCSAIDNVKNKKVAIKKILKAFDHLTDGKRTLREIKLMRHFQHENVLCLEEILTPVNYTAFDDVYLVTELMDTDLHQIISSNQPLTDDHCQYFMYQVLRGLKYIHSADVLHRDLKPSNLLLNGNCDLKICDFGLARISHETEPSEANFMTEYVATRWYRAPEILLSNKQYTKAIDIWSVGCIFAELFLRKPIFPGRDYIHQLRLVTDFLGTPTRADVASIASSKAQYFIESLPFKAPMNFASLFPNANPLAVDLLRRMLVFNPAARITCEEALAHPYLASLHDPNDEPAYHSTFDFDFERLPLTKDYVKELTFCEMLHYHPEAIVLAPERPILPVLMRHGGHVPLDAQVQVQVHAHANVEMSHMDMGQMPLQDASMAPEMASTATLYL